MSLAFTPFCESGQKLALFVSKYEDAIVSASSITLALKVVIAMANPNASSRSLNFVQELQIYSSSVWHSTKPSFLGSLVYSTSVVEQSCGSDHQIPASSAVEALNSQLSFGVVATVPSSCNRAVTPAYPFRGSCPFSSLLLPKG